MGKVANEGKSLVVEVDGVGYERIPVKTHIITDVDTVSDVLVKYIKPIMQEGDIIFMSEKAVACTQKRAIKMSDIHPRPLATFLSRYVYKTPYGIGLGIPQTMEMALQECGTIRILFAAAISVIGKLFGQRGWFYMVAGEKARSIDGPCDCTIPPYNEYVVLGPVDPDKTAEIASKKSGCPLFAIVDLNDLGGNILGVSTPSLTHEYLLKILCDNPLGQSTEQTPLGIIRKVSADVKSSDENTAKSWFESNKENMIADLRRIVAIRSVSDPDSEVKPFGQSCKDVLDEMLRICEEHGIECKNYDYYCGSAFLKGETDKEVGIWSHLDVVPDAGDWKFPPFDGKIVDGFMVGRGVIDNKSAAIMGLYLMLYFRENKIPLKSGIRLFFGCNEENGMLDQKYYIEHNKLPDYSLIPDAEFPVGYCEKGILALNLNSPALSSSIIALEAGLVGNMVADKAYIKLVKTPELAEKIATIADASACDDHIEIRAVGKATHAAYPQGSVNAINVLSKLLIENNLISEADKKAFSFISEITGDYTGEILGINVSHQEFGELTCISGKLNFAGGKAVLNLNIRYPYGENGDIITTVIKSRAIEHGFTLTDANNRPPSHVAKDSDFVKALVSSFSEVTGSDLAPVIMCGGTYARNLPNAVAFGHIFPHSMAKHLDLPDGHGDVHQPDEALNLDEFMTSLEIYVNTIKRINELI